MSEDRAVSTTLGYVLALAISALLITGLITAGGNYVEDERDQVVRDQLSVIGQQVAADIERADRLVRAVPAGTQPDTVRINQTFADDVTGTSYRIRLDPSGSDTVIVESFDPEISVSVRVTSETDIVESSADGGPIQIRYTGSDELEVRDV
jgi:hypothetical protein